MPESAAKDKFLTISGLYLTVLSYLNLCDIFTMELVSKQWRAIVKDFWATTRTLRIDQDLLASHAEYRARAEYLDLSLLTEKLRAASNPYPFVVHWFIKNCPKIASFSVIGNGTVKSVSSDSSGLSAGKIAEISCKIARNYHDLRTIALEGLLCARVEDLIRVLAANRGVGVLSCSNSGGLAMLNDGPERSEQEKGVLRSLEHLRSVDLTGCKQLGAWVHLLPRPENLVSLKICCKVSAKIAEQLHFVTTCSNLRELGLEFAESSAHHLLGDFWENMPPGIEQLSVKNNPKFPDSLSFTNFVLGLKNLRELSLTFLEEALALNLARRCSKLSRLSAEMCRVSKERENMDQLEYLMDSLECFDCGCIFYVSP